MGARTALLARAEFHLLGVSSHLAGARPSFAPSQMKGQGWIAGKHGSVGLRTEDFKPTLLLGRVSGGWPLQRAEACGPLRLGGGSGVDQGR